MLHSNPDVADNNGGGDFCPTEDVNSKMQPKPIDSRHILDIDAQKRLVDMEGIIQHLRSVRGNKEHPAETDYDIIHDEAGRRNRERAAEEIVKRLKKARAESTEDSAGHGEEASGDAKPPSNGRKGSRLDIKA